MPEGTGWMPVPSRVSPISFQSDTRARARAAVRVWVVLGVVAIEPRAADRRQGQAVVGDRVDHTSAFVR